MRPDLTLIFPSSPFLLDQAVFPPLGIMYLSAYAKRYGLTVQCLDLGIGHTPEMAESDIIGISFTTPQRDEAFKIAKRFNQEGRQAVIAGGPHATHMSNECLRHGFTHAAVGQGESVMMKFMTNLLHRQIHYDLRPEIDDYPFPDRDALSIHRYHYMINGEMATPIMTTRGCPYGCSFCGKIDKNFQMQSAERTISEMDHIYETYGFAAFMIFDDVFVASKRRLAEMGNIIGGKYTLRCFARSNLLDDEACRLLKRLGVVEVGIGIESGSTEVLKKNMKGTTREMNSNAVKKLHDHGIRAKAFLIVGLPGETDSTVMETADWVHDAKPDDVDVSIFQPMPGSPIFASPEKWGIQFEYNGQPGWYKGTPGQYESMARTEHLTGNEILGYRDMLEDEFKKPEMLR
jgi:anaerobic magnesium-protoporphyrin IX monomethyl ester cyclase